MTLVEREYRRGIDESASLDRGRWFLLIGPDGGVFSGTRTPHLDTPVQSTTLIYIEVVTIGNFSPFFRSYISNLLLFII